MYKFDASTLAIAFLGLAALGAIFTKQQDVALSAVSAMAGAITMKATLTK